MKEQTIETGRFDDGEWTVYEHGEYDESSVLAGQYRKAFLDSYHPSEYSDPLAAARKDYPEARVDHSPFHPPKAQLPVNPEPWFDPLAAGEAWGEDDY